MHRCLLGNYTLQGQLDYARLFAEFYTLLANGMVPLEVSRFYSGPTLLILLQGSKARPLTMGIPNRNIAGKVHLKSASCKSTCENYLQKGGQLGVNIANGCEKVVHTVNYSEIDIQPTILYFMMLKMLSILLIEASCCLKLVRRIPNSI